MEFFLSKHEDLNLAPPNPWKAGHNIIPALLGEAETGEFPEACGPGSPAYAAAHNKRRCLKQGR